MGSRASEETPSSKTMIQTVESTMLLNDKAGIKPYDPSSSKKSPTCWPGVVVQDAYATPQSQGSKYGFLNHPRTPYSRTLLSKSKSKVCFFRYSISCTSMLKLYLKLFCFLFSFSPVDSYPGQLQPHFINSSPSVTDKSVSEGNSHCSVIVILFDLLYADSFNALQTADTEICM